MWFWLNSFKIIDQNCLKASGSFATNQIKSCLYIVYETVRQLRIRLGTCWFSRLKNKCQENSNQKKKERKKKEWGFHWWQGWNKSVRIRILTLLFSVGLGVVSWGFKCMSGHRSPIHTNTKCWSEQRSKCHLWHSGGQVFQTQIMQLRFPEDTRTKKQVLSFAIPPASLCSAVVVLPGRIRVGVKDLSLKFLEQF